MPRDVAEEQATAMAVADAVIRCQRQLDHAPGSNLAIDDPWPLGWWPGAKNGYLWRIDDWQDPVGAAITKACHRECRIAEFACS